MNYKFAQLIQNPGQKSKTISEVYIAQPDSHKESLAGKLFVLSEIYRNDAIGIKLINFLTDSIVQNFYQNEKLLLRERMPSLKVEHIFEASLAKTNLQLSEFVKKEKIKLSQELLSITTGVVFKNEIYIANNGKNKVNLIFPALSDKQDSSHDKYQLANIIKDSESPDETKSYKLFSDVLSGKIPPSASVFISNEALPEYISQKQLLNIISSLPPMSAMEQIKNTVNSINAYVSFAAIIVRNTSLDQKQISNQKNLKIDSNKSIQALNRAEDTTEALLAPTGFISFKKWIHLLSPSTYLPVKKTLNQNLALKDKIFVKKNSQLRKIKNIIARFFTNIFTALSRLFSTINFRNLTINLKSDFPGSKIFTKLNGFLPIVLSFIKNKKFLLGLSLFFILLFVLNLKNTEKDIKITEEAQKYEEQIQSIEKKQNQAEASLLYSNDEGAKKLFDEINQMLSELPQNTEEQQHKYLDFKGKFDEQLEKIRRIMRTDSATIISDFKDQSSRAQISSIKFIESLNKLYGSDPNQKSIYILDLFENIATTLTDLENPIDTLVTPLKLKNSNDEDVIYYFNNSNLITINTKTEEIGLSDIQLNSIQEKVPAGIYNSNIYVADRQNNNIYRYSKTGNNFGAGTPWLNSPMDLNGLIDLAIDGHIYVLYANAQVVKLLRGEKVVFELEGIDPPLVSADRMKISEERKYLYIMDSSLNRLVVFDKEGQFLMQYQGDNLSSLIDFEIDEKQQIIYFLTSTRIQKFNAVHFE